MQQQKNLHSSYVQTPCWKDDGQYKHQLYQNNFQQEFALLVIDQVKSVNRFVGNFGSFESIINYPILTTASEKREIPLRYKNGDKIENLSDPKDLEFVKSNVKKIVFKSANKIIKTYLSYR